MCCREAGRFQWVMADDRYHGLHQIFSAAPSDLPSRLHSTTGCYLNALTENKPCRMKGWFSTTQLMCSKEKERAMKWRENYYHFATFLSRKSILIICSKALFLISTLCWEWQWTKVIQKISHPLMPQGNSLYFFSILLSLNDGFYGNIVCGSGPYYFSRTCKETPEIWTCLFLHCAYFMIIADWILSYFFFLFNVVRA